MQQGLSWANGLTTASVTASHSCHMTKLKSSKCVWQIHDQVWPDNSSRYCMFKWKKRQVRLFSIVEQWKRNSGWGLTRTYRWHSVDVILDLVLVLWNLKYSKHIPGTFWGFSDWKMLSMPCDPHSVLLELLLSQLLHSIMVLLYRIWSHGVIKLM